jgi:hypothetical protein
MDRVRFGRALGYGARHAAKALTQAVDAATTPDSRPGTPRPASRPVVADAARSVVEAQRTVHQTQSRVKTAARMAGKSALAPVAKFSSVLWLEVTGTFFGMVALVMGEAVWKLRASFRLSPGTHEAQKLYMYAAIFLVFVYFAASSFIRAWHRQRR